MNRKPLITLSALAGCALAFSLPSMALAAAQSVTDHATFDSTNPANVESGAYCYSASNPPGPGGLNPQPWKLYVNVSNIGAAPATFKIRDNGGGFVQYPVAANSSVSIEYAAGNNNGSRAFRVDATGTTSLSGYVSAESLLVSTTNVFCTSCDEDDAGHVFCDTKIAN